MSRDKTKQNVLEFQKIELETHTKKHKDDNIHKIKAKKIRRHFHILLYKVVSFLVCSEGSR